MVIIIDLMFVTFIVLVIQLKNNLTLYTGNLMLNHIMIYHGKLLVV